MWDWLTKLSSLRQEGERVAVVTVAGTTGSTPREVGAKMIVTREKFFGTIGGGRLEELAIADARAALETGEAKALRYPLGAKTGQCCGGIVECFVEILDAGPRLYVFGAGHVGQAIAKTLVDTAFSVHLIDEREEWIRHPALPESVVRHACSWEEFVDEAPWDETRTFVAILTHRHDTDEQILKRVLTLPTRWVGLIGSRAKWERFRHRLGGQGVAEQKLAGVHCPMGLPMGNGKAPQEIAVSVAAELLQTYYA